MTNYFYCALQRLQLVALALICAATNAYGFGGYVSPSRFELAGKPGQVISNVLEIGNDELSAASYKIYSADWTLDASGAVLFDESAPTAASCRPWLRLERRQLKLGARGTRKLRFEVHIPADTKPMLCRFALMIDDDTDGATDVKIGNIQLPVAGRIGVVVYVAVGDVKANIEIQSIASETYQSRFMPVATVRNSGTLHARLEGTLEGRDATGQSIDFAVATLPILPGETRKLPIWPNEDSKGKPPTVNYPLRLSGVIEWLGGKFKVDTTLAPAPAGAAIKLAAPKLP